MRKKFFYPVVSALTAILCFTGCSQSGSTDSTSDRRALEDDNTQEKSAVQTTVTTLTPLQTLAKITPIDNTQKQEEITTGKPAETVTKQPEETSDADGQSEWFESNRLFELDIMDDSSYEHVQTWYRFPGNEETTATTVSVTQPLPAEQTLPLMITRSAMDFVPGE